MYILYITLVRSKLQYASVIRNSITSTDANKLERFLQMFVDLYVNLSFPQGHYNCPLALKQLKLHTLRNSKYRRDAPLLT
jgi:hypothetical protein